jgi:protein-L-isoaspartate(D-aspartate) O-methyltransferase
MSWTAGCTGTTNDELVDRLKQARLITKPSVEEAMRRTDRGNYVPVTESCATPRSATYHYGPYADSPQSIGFKVTISAPHIHAICLDQFSEIVSRKGSKILDMGRYNIISLPVLCVNFFS